MEWIFALFIWFIWGVICYTMANNRGRNGTLGFLGGLVFGFFSVVYYWVVGDSAERRAEKEVKHVASIARALKKELKKEEGNNDPSTPA